MLPKCAASIPQRYTIRSLLAIYVVSFSKSMFRCDLTSWKAVLQPSRKNLALHLNSITEHAISEVCQCTPSLATRARHGNNNCWYCIVGGTCIHKYDIYNENGNCTPFTRPRLLLHCFDSIGLWPITRAIEASILDFQNAVDILLQPSGGSLFHDCVAEDRCPLLQEFVKIKSSTQAVMDNFKWIEITDMCPEARSEFLLM